MKTRAPGKLVISGAYAVLRGAPAIVTAADRYATADDSQVADFKTPEVEAALAILTEDQLLAEGTLLDHPSFDASALRSGDRKLGLGSSAAILAASLWSVRERLVLPPEQDARDLLFDVALRAHRRAQGGGSGVDVATAFYGGTSLMFRRGQTLQIKQGQLPTDLVWEVWSMPTAASTSEFVEKVQLAEKDSPDAFVQAFVAQCQASENAAAALGDDDAKRMLLSLRDQHQALGLLGEIAGVPIVMPEVAKLHASLPDTACFLPSGAGGGDVTLYIGSEPSSEAFAQQAAAVGIVQVQLTLAAPGVQDSPLDGATTIDGAAAK